MGSPALRCRPPDAASTATLPALSTNTDLAATVSLTKAATGGGTYTSVLGRRIAGQGAYQLDLKLAADKSLRLSLSRTVAGTQTSLGRRDRREDVRRRHPAARATSSSRHGHHHPPRQDVGRCHGAVDLERARHRLDPAAAGARHPGVLGIPVRLRNAGAGRHHRRPRSDHPDDDHHRSCRLRLLHSRTSPNLTNQSTKSFSFTANTAGSRFQCRLDGATWAACTSPTAYSALADGDHAFAVRAVDADGFSAPAATYSWTVDTTPPAVTIDGGPSDGSLTSAKDAAFNLSSSEAASFECQLDGAAAQPCDASASWTALADGSHDLAVRATDLAGNTGPLQHRTWTIDATAPTRP